MRGLRSAVVAVVAVGAVFGLVACGADSLDGAAVVEGFSKKGLPATATVTFTAETDPEKLLGQSGGYESKVAFADERAARKALGSKQGDVVAGGHVEVFPNEDAAGARLDRLLKVAKITGKEYVFSWGTVVVRLSPELTSEQADKYIATLKQIVG
ncbi:hypothetical protein [Sinosporangium album]|uniref:hypothetical protein n=1 Tax=Sinosporangium album TaxID=504805 RepID=UPI000B815E7C|nr:hypothetical protein [Sinosporangium album]